jgi:L-asparaginase/Glu-tRNA(Gln) amidotransferase subunit D
VSAERTLRKATADDIARQVGNANSPLSDGAILSGMGLGNAQLGILAAFNEAIEAGLIVVHHIEPGPVHMPHIFYAPTKGST